MDCEHWVVEEVGEPGYCCVGEDHGEEGDYCDPFVYLLHHFGWLGFVLGFYLGLEVGQEPVSQQRHHQQSNPNDLRFLRSLSNFRIKVTKHKYPQRDDNSNNNLLSSQGQIFLFHPRTQNSHQQY